MRVCEFLVASSLSWDFLLRDLIFTLGIPGIGAVGRLGHFADHATWSSALHAAHLAASSGVLQFIVACVAPHLRHLTGVLHWSVVWVYREHLEHGVGVGAGGLEVSTA